MPPPVMPIFFWIDSVYALVMIVACLMIFFRTREMYALTDHKGIHYFSLTFLFFSLAYCFRFFSRLFFRIFFMGVFMQHRAEMAFGLAMFVLSSSLAALFLLKSVIWRKKSMGLSRLIYIFVGIITIISFLTLNPAYHIMGLGVIYLATALISLFKRKKVHKLHIAYLLLFVFWLLTTISLEIPKFMFNLRFGIDLFSLGIIFLILWRVMHE